MNSLFMKSEKEVARGGGTQLTKKQGFEIYSAGIIILPFRSLSVSLCVCYCS